MEKPGANEKNSENTAGWITLRALSLKQPWANLVAAGRKTVETRTWRTAYRGPLIIVSSRRPPVEPAGCAVALAELVDCRPMTREDEKAAGIALYPGAQAWILKNIRPLRPFPLRGALGLYSVTLRRECLEER